jgi:hypothetical protein
LLVAGRPDPLSVTNRNKNDPSFTDFSGGFRVVLGGE